MNGPRSARGAARRFRSIALCCVAIMGFSVATDVASRTGVLPGADASSCTRPPWIYDPQTAVDDQMVAALASDIFIGRVLARSGGSGNGTPMPGPSPTESPVYYPEARLTVEVMAVIKGSAAGLVEVRQYQSTVPGCWASQILPDPPLQAGDTALFLAQTGSDGRGYALLISHFGYYRIEDEQEQTTLTARFATATGSIASPVATPF